MKRYVSTPSAIYATGWDGTTSDKLIGELNAAGWATYVQTPMPGQQVAHFDDEKDSWGKIAAPARLVIVGPYRQQVYSVDAEQYLSWSDGDSGFHGQDHEPGGKNWAQDLDAVSISLPTPEDFKANAALEDGERW